jgi:phosphoribosyl 1,2-cyclic phosphodiesterase
MRGRQSTRCRSVSFGGNMKINCWGCRGSIPVSGPEYDFHGGDTPCLEIRTADDRTIIVDCGTGVRRLGNALLGEGRQELSIVFTHAHWDHIIGFPFFKPIYHAETRITFYGCPFAQKSIKTILAMTMEPPFFPVKLDEVKAEFSFQDSCISDFSVGSVHVQPVLLSHPNQGLGYRFTEGGKTFVYLTDNELGYQHPGGLLYGDYLDFCRGADLLIHDAEYTDEEYRRTRTWGHSTYREALQLALDAKVGRFGLFHHNQERSDGELQGIVDECRRIIFDAKSPLECFALTQETMLEL